MHKLIEEKVFRIRTNEDKFNFILENTNITESTVIKAAVVANQNEFHSFGHALGVAESAIKIALQENRPRNERTLLALIGLFHDAGHKGRMDINDEMYAFELAKTILQDHDIAGVELPRPVVMQKLRDGILATTFSQRGKINDTFLHVIQDADLAHMGLGPEYQIRASTGLIEEFNREREIPMTPEDFFYVEQEKFIKYLSSIPGVMQEGNIRLSKGATDLFRNPFDYIEIIKTLPASVITYANDVKRKDVPFDDFKHEVTKLRLAA